MLGMYSRASPLTSKETTARLEDVIARLDEQIRGAGATPVHVYLPTTADLRANELLALTHRSADAYDLDHYRDALRRESARAAVQLVDLTAVLKAEHAKGAPLGFMQDMHYNAGAHVVIARALFDEIVERGRSQGEAAAAAHGATLRPTSARTGH
jgi:lysophospholipase L1-like esterase